MELTGSKRGRSQQHPEPERLLLPPKQSAESIARARVQCLAENEGCNVDSIVDKSDSFVLEQICVALELPLLHKRDACVVRPDDVDLWRYVLRDPRHADGGTAPPEAGEEDRADDARHATATHAPPGRQ